VTTNANIQQVQALLARAELVRVSRGDDGRVPVIKPPGMRIVARGDNPRLREEIHSGRASFRHVRGLVAEPEFPSFLLKGEFELEFGDGYQGVTIRYRAPAQRTTLRGGTADPEFQTWLDGKIEAIRSIAEVVNLEDAVKSVQISERGLPTQWTAIFEPKQLEITAPQLEVVSEEIVEALGQG
jgi:hypothetical protein